MKSARVCFCVPGNPVGYLRMTQGQVKLMRIPDCRLRPDALAKKKQIRKYLAYKDHVFAISMGRSIDRSPKRKVYLNVMIYFYSGKHPDPGNVRKGIEDAIFANDNKVAGFCDFGYDSENPRVEVEILHE